MIAAAILLAAGVALIGLGLFGPYRKSDYDQYVPLLLIGALLVVVMLAWFALHGVIHLLIAAVT